ncbi:hypothetical protein [Marinifilum sp. D714]|uniref:hypothetical protein n=1 Tax=Marinifilum sp. D714 TaxID=2937523 RepID=UPI0027BB4ECE|nr:hypothetical protein [Marinifilum sp. D714]MDQ2178005.1 hypothetical protein [Marinifilum sp. D714]
MGIVVVPLFDEKVEAWKAWAKSLSNEKSNEFNDFNKKYGLTRHNAWLAETPGGKVVVALHEGPGADDFLHKVAGSNDSFELYFKEKLTEFHGMKFDAPPPPMPVQMI